MYIGVYGTLRIGQRANYMMKNTTLVGTFTEELPFTMVDLGSFPALLDSEEPKKATFEVYDMQDDDAATLRQLDNYEGYPAFYDRKAVKISNGMEVWFYFMKRSETAYHGEVIKDGDWLNVK